MHWHSHTTLAEEVQLVPMKIECHVQIAPSLFRMPVGQVRLNLSGVNNVVHWHLQEEGWINGRLRSYASPICLQEYNLGHISFAEVELSTQSTRQQTNLGQDQLIPVYTPEICAQSPLGRPKQCFNCILLACECCNVATCGLRGTGHTPRQRQATAAALCCPTREVLPNELRAGSHVC